ncbi:hypothetical protein B7463_g12321, partial [Scytalidium lignicola]
MSFRGTPSKGCAPCRAKRTKCDYTRPSCSQCLRAGRDCHGYRDPSKLRFFHQTPQGIARKDARTPPRTPSNALALRGPSEARSSPKSECSVQTISPCLSDSLEFQATCFFLSNYAWEGTQSSKGLFDYIPGILNAQESTGGALMDAVMALGLAGISITKNGNSKIMISAKERYNRALAATNCALQTDEAKADQTLIAVMLLGLFETNTCDAPRSMKSWTRHTNGAIQLLYLRGKEQLQTYTGRKIFIQLRSQIIVHALQRRARVPDFVTEWSLSNLQHETDEHLIANHLCLLTIECCNLRATMTSMHDFTNSFAIVSAALELDSTLEIWAAENPYVYNIVPLKTRTDSVFADYYHTYPNILVATSWNTYRSVRILLNELLLAQMGYLISQEAKSMTTPPPDETEAHFTPSLSPDSSSTSPSSTSKYRSLMRRSHAVLVHLTQDICASVPFYLGDPAPPSSLLQPPPPPRAAGGNLLLWPLFMAACTNMTSDLMRSWVMQQMEKIAEDMGIRQAQALAILLCLGRDPPVWHDAELLEVEPDGEKADERWPIIE